MPFLPALPKDVKETELRENWERGGDGTVFQSHTGPSALAPFPDFPKLQFLACAVGP